MLDFFGPNASSALLMAAGQHSEWTTLQVIKPMDDAWSSEGGFWLRWGDHNDGHGGVLPGRRARLLSLGLLSLAARNAEDDAAGGAKAQQLAISTASIQLGLLLGAAVQVGSAA